MYQYNDASSTNLSIYYKRSLNTRERVLCTSDKYLNTICLTPDKYQSVINNNSIYNPSEVI